MNITDELVDRVMRAMVAARHAADPKECPYTTLEELFAADPEPDKCMTKWKYNSKIAIEVIVPIIRELSA